MAPELFVALYRAHRQHHSERALELHYTIVRLQLALSGLPLIAATTSLPRMRGLGTTTSHTPMGALTDDQESELHRRVGAEPPLQSWLAPI
ncbi:MULTISPECIES: hypothetical protein [Rhodococcus]|uniref:hypothetical protein n=1 Tax=Rhodococcus TaxID=1827 RepID=UPI001357B1A4|nr:MULTISPECIES: hypothetical protein [Rhodococcus]KAF0964937.1 hypothetical protein MLGJGCBP_01931 [Rhodococcus sp. T7]UOT08318.1 hypothetical protein MPY17_39100 [Rhodococcus opacus]